MQRRVLQFILFFHIHRLLVIFANQLSIRHNVYIHLCAIFVQHFGTFVLQQHLLSAPSTERTARPPKGATLRLSCFSVIVINLSASANVSVSLIK